MVSVDRMPVPIQSVSVKALEILCAAVAEALAPQACDLKAEDLLSPFHLMCNLRNPSFSCIQV